MHPRFQGSGPGVNAQPTSEWFPQFEDVTSIYSNLRLSSGPFPRFMKDASYLSQQSLNTPTPVLLRYHGYHAGPTGFHHAGANTSSMWMNQNMDMRCQSPTTPRSEPCTSPHFAPDGGNVPPGVLRFHTPGKVPGTAPVGYPHMRNGYAPGTPSLRSYQGSPLTHSPQLAMSPNMNADIQLHSAQKTLSREPPLASETHVSPTGQGISASANGNLLYGNTTPQSVPDLSPSAAHFSHSRSRLTNVNDTPSPPSNRIPTPANQPDVFTTQTPTQHNSCTENSEAPSKSEPSQPPLLLFPNNQLETQVPTVQLEAAEAEPGDPRDTPYDGAKRGSMLGVDQQEGQRLSGVDAIDAFFRRSFAIDESDLDSVDGLRFSMASRASGRGGFKYDTDLPPLPNSNETNSTGASVECVFPPDGLRQMPPANGDYCETCEPEFSQNKNSAPPLVQDDRELPIPPPKTGTIRLAPLDRDTLKSDDADYIPLVPLNSLPTSNDLPLISLEQGSQHQENDQVKDKSLSPSLSSNTTPFPPLEFKRESVSERVCRRCNCQIDDVIVRSFDGMLDGVYHKDCFNCTLCNARFPTGEFYVIDGKPFCEQHYHEWHGTICTVCGRGVEGVYYVTDDPANYHISCLYCEQEGCGKLLSEFFVYDKRRFCEEHAVQNARDSAHETPSKGNGYRGLERRLTMLVNAPSSIGISADA